MSDASLIDLGSVGGRLNGFDESVPLGVISSPVGSPEAECSNTTGIGVGVLAADDGLEEGTSCTPFLNISPIF